MSNITILFTDNGDGDHHGDEHSRGAESDSHD